MSRVALLPLIVLFAGCETQFEGRLDGQSSSAAPVVEPQPVATRRPKTLELAITFPAAGDDVQRVSAIIGTSNLPADVRVVPVIVPQGDNQSYRQQEARVDENGRWLSPGCVFGPVEEGEYRFVVYATATLADGRSVSSEYITVKRGK